MSYTGSFVKETEIIQWGGGGVGPICIYHLLVGAYLRLDKGYLIEAVTL